jgi:uncharacterized protein (DUF488 family)
MTDEARLHTDAARGVRAKSLIENELLQEAFDVLERDYSAALFGTKPQDQISREKLYLAVNVVRKVRDHIARVISDGKLAEKQLQELATEAERKKRFGII